jgi:fused signal recognition particle receptor
MSIESLVGILVAALLFGGLLFIFIRSAKKGESLPHIPTKDIEEAIDAARGAPELEESNDISKTKPVEIKIPERVQVGKLPDSKSSQNEQTPTPTKALPKTLQEALQNTKKGFFGRIQSVLSGKSALSDSDIEEIEEVLYTSDLGPKAVQRLMLKMQTSLDQKSLSSESIKSFFKTEILEVFTGLGEIPNLFLKQENGDPTVWMIVGVNGAGKTTTIGKLANRLSKDGKKVLIAAGDTFRAAAKEQLTVWSQRANVEIFAPEGIDSPSGLAFDATKKAKSEGFDFLIVDTAGRLHTQVNLMEELKKVKRVMDKALPGTPHETLLVLDSNQGQNALIQAKEFHNALGLTGVILTKLDGTAKGGVALGVAVELSVPIRLIGVGEGVDDLRDFNSQEFVDSIL